MMGKACPLAGHGSRDEARPGFRLAEHVFAHHNRLFLASSLLNDNGLDHGLRRFGLSFHLFGLPGRAVAQFPDGDQQQHTDRAEARDARLRQCWGLPTSRVRK